MTSMTKLMTMTMKTNGEDSHPRPTSTTGEKSPKTEDHCSLVFLRYAKISHQKQHQSTPLIILKNAISTNHALSYS